MEHLPIEVVGEILSRISDARAVVLASATCRKWRQAFREHLRALSFLSSDDCFQELSARQIEVAVTRTIFQTANLQSLLIYMAGREYDFSSAAVMSWLLYTRKSLKELHYSVRARADSVVNVLDILGREKLEKLTLWSGVLQRVHPNYHRFSSLTSLSLSYVYITDLDLYALVSVCPKLEYLKLSHLNYPPDGDPIVEIEVRAPNLRKFVISGIFLDKLIVESDCIEHLRVCESELKLVKVIGKNGLKNISINNADVLDLDLCDSAVNLETIEIYKSGIPMSVLYRLLSKSSKLQMLMLLDVEFFEWTVPFDLDTIAMCCPQLSHLYLLHDLINGDDDDDDEQFPYCLRGSTPFQNVVYLNVGCAYIHEDKLLELLESLLERCPRLKKLTIEGTIASLEEQPMARHTRSISRIRGNCIVSNVEFKFVFSPSEV